MTEAADRMPVVLAHGWGGSYRTTWRGSSLEGALEAAGRPLIRLDLPGHGKRLQSHDPDHYAGIAEQLRKGWADEAIVDAVGFSLGGKLLLDLLARRRARVRRLVIAGVGGNLFRAEDGAAIARALLRPGCSRDAAAGPIVAAARASGNDLAALAAVIRRPPSVVPPEALAGLSAEVLLVAGRADTFIGDPEILRDAIEGSRLLWLDGVDHLGTPVSPAFAVAASAFVLGQVPGRRWRARAMRGDRPPFLANRGSGLDRALE